MWDSKSEWIKADRILRYQILQGTETLRFNKVLELWSENEAFRTYFNQLLASCPFSAFRWETPAVVASNGDQVFQFVLLRSDSLARPVDRQAFDEHFQPERLVVRFTNLGRNAILVVPCPNKNTSTHGHLAAFVRGAPPTQRDALWQEVANAMRDRIGKRPVWLSTAGMGVSWLHVRLDNRPKYYGYAPFREAPH